MPRPKAPPEKRRLRGPLARNQKIQTRLTVAEREALAAIRQPGETEAEQVRRLLLEAITSAAG